MISTKTALSALSVAAFIGLGSFASAGGASAAVACNNAGDCWHTDSRYKYDRDLHVQYHSDDWYFHQKWDNEHHFRDYHEGRGGYRNGIWFSF